jgi:hypothetical protein
MLLSQPLIVTDIFQQEQILYFFPVVYSPVTGIMHIDIVRGGIEQFFAFEMGQIFYVVIDHKITRNSFF